MFPEGGLEGVYNTADATLWFIHALDRYVSWTQDRQLIPTYMGLLREIMDHHIRGTLFGIGMDEKDGLLRQGSEGLALTWMDAKMDDWVVTPRRGKAVEINALWYNALCVVSAWLAEAGQVESASEMETLARRVRDSFNERFWDSERGHLRDVIDGPGG